MATRKELLSGELMREILSIRIDTLWNMIAMRQIGRFPAVDEEKASGQFDDKGALFVPGGFVVHDWQDRRVTPTRLRDRTASGFRTAVRAAMRYDGAHLLYPGGIATRVTLGNTAFAKIAARILEIRKEALRRRSVLGERRPPRIGTDEITKSYCPVYLDGPYGTRTSLSAAISACMTEPRLFFRQCENYFDLRLDEAAEVWDGIRSALFPSWGRDGALLAQPWVVTCHNTRYHEDNYTGLTRISGYGKFGEFATLTLERATDALFDEAACERDEYEDDVVARDRGEDIVVVLRTYPPTNPGARLRKGIVTSIVSPERDLGIDADPIIADAQRRYGVA